MNDVNIFDVTTDRPESEWASFKEIGDKVQGVYVGKRYGTDSYQNEQVIYELLDKTRNVVVNVAIRLSKKPVIDIMDKCFLGQIIGFVYKEDTKTKDGKSTFKSIAVREDPKIFDAEFVADQKARGLHTAPSARVEPLKSGYMSAEDKQVDADFEAMTTAEADVPFMSDSDYLKGIAELARTKLNVVNPSLVKDAVMEATDLAFTKANYEEIYERLGSM